MRTNRNDCHRPGALVPADYRRVLSFAWAGGGQFPDNLPYNVDVLLDMRSKLPFFRKENGKGGCDVCGANFRFGDVLVHEPTGEHVVVGHECADKIEGLGDRAEFLVGLRASRTAALAQLKREEKARARAEFLAARTGLAEALQGDHRILRDLAERLEKWGTLSEGQVGLALKIAAELASPAPKGEVPSTGERVTVRGRVVSTKVVDSNYGSTTKMLVEVETPAGAYRVFGKVPAGLPVDRGAEVEFSAKLERSERDPSFGFFSRPTKAVLLSRGSTLVDGKNTTLYVARLLGPGSPAEVVHHTFLAASYPDAREVAAHRAKELGGYTVATIGDAASHAVLEAERAAKRESQVGTD